MTPAKWHDGASSFDDVSIAPPLDIPGRPPTLVLDETCFVQAAKPIECRPQDLIVASEWFE
jgi:hypothetical protein